MPCFYCGKPISFVRRLADPDFCSEDHRQKYHELTRLGLQRLVETRDRLEAAGPRRKRQREAATVGSGVPPLPVDLLPEHLAAVPVVGQLNICGDFAPVPLPLQIPAVRSPVFTASCSTKQWAPAGTPSSVQTSEAPPALGGMSGMFLPLAPHAEPAWSRLGLAAAPRCPGLPVLSILAPRELQAAGADGRTPVVHEAFTAARAPRLPSGQFASRAPAPPSTTVLFAPPTPPARPALPAAYRAGGEVEILAAPALLPSETPLPSRSFGPGLTGAGGLQPPSPPPLAPAASPATTASAPAAFTLPPHVVATEVMRPAAGLAVCSSVPGGPAPPPAPAAPPAATAPAPAAFTPPPPRIHATEVMLPAGGLALCSTVLGAPAPPFQRPPRTFLETGQGILLASCDTTFRHGSIWRLQPVRLELPSLIAPPAFSGWLPVSPPQSGAQAGQAVTAPLEPWGQPAPSLVPARRGAGLVVLSSAGPIRLALPAEELRAEPRMARTAPSPEFPITRQFYIGWGATSLRQALSSAQPLRLEMGAGRAGLSVPRETPPPGFRIAAWAFTHAPGLARATVTPEGALLPVGLPAPVDPASGHAPCMERPQTPPAAPAFPHWRAGLAEERLPTAAVEPPEAGYARLPALRPLSGTTALPWQPAVEFPGAKVGWPAGLVRFVARAPRLRWPATTCALAVPPPHAGTVDLTVSRTLEFATVTQLPVPHQLGALALAPADPATACPALAPPLHEPAAGPPPPIGWQTPGALPASFRSVRPSLPPVDWDPAMHWRRPPLAAPAGGSVSPGLASVAMSHAPVAWPPVTSVVARGAFRCAPLSQLSAPPPLDPAAARSPRLGAVVSAAPPRAVILTAVTFALPEVRLLAPAPVPGDGQAQDVPKTLRQPSLLAPAPSSIALPVGPGVPACSRDLFWPYAAPLEPASPDQAHALRDQPKLAPIGPSMLYQARPLAPIPHRFERLPHETEFVPAVRVARFWKRIPRRAVLAIAAPALVLLLCVLLWNPVREAARRRAAVTIDDDFSTGMGLWTGGAAGWSRDPAGFALVGSLALLGPSLRMTDYRLEFQGQVERESLAWVFRARDLENYYAMKIAVLKPGPLPTLALIRYRVLSGEPTLPVQVPVRVMLHNESTFRVQMRVSGSDFTTFVNQQQVDFWTDDRLASGGIGFFCDKGSRARLYWVKITHQDDLVGKLCSYFAPSDLSRNGSWK